MESSLLSHWKSTAKGHNLTELREQYDKGRTLEPEKLALMCSKTRTRLVDRIGRQRRHQRVAMRRMGFNQDIYNVNRALAAAASAVAAAQSFFSAMPPPAPLPITPPAPLAVLPPPPPLLRVEAAYYTASGQLAVPAPPLPPLLTLDAEPTASSERSCGSDNAKCDEDDGEGDGSIAWIYDEYNDGVTQEREDSESTEILNLRAQLAEALAEKEKLRAEKAAAINTCPPPRRATRTVGTRNHQKACEMMPEFLKKEAAEELREAQKEAEWRSTPFYAAQKERELKGFAELKRKVEESLREPKQKEFPTFLTLDSLARLNGRNGLRMPNGYIWEHAHLEKWRPGMRKPWDDESSWASSWVDPSQSSVAGFYAAVGEPWVPCMSPGQKERMEEEAKAIAQQRCERVRRANERRDREARENSRVTAPSNSTWKPRRQW